MKPFLKKHNFTVIVSAFLLVIIGGVNFLALPLIQSIRSKADTIQEKIIDNEIKTKRVEQISQMEEDHALIGEKKNFFEVILDKEKEVTFISGLEKMAEETGNQIELSIGEANDPNKKEKPTTGASKKKDEEKSIAETLSYKDYFLMEIKLKGDYDGLVNFMSRLENFEYRVNVLSLGIKKEKEKEKSELFARAGDLFQPVKSEEGKVISEEKPEEKEILSSVISLVVYTKK